MFFLELGYSSPLPTLPDTLTKANYSVTILASPINGLGYEAYALTLSHFIHFHFPDWRIQVVIEDVSGRLRKQTANDKSLFHYPDTAEVFYLSSSYSSEKQAYLHPEADKAKVQQWINESFITLLAAEARFQGINIPYYNCIDVQQINTPLSFLSASADSQLEMIRNHRSLQKSMSLTAEVLSLPDTSGIGYGFLKNYWLDRTDISMEDLSVLSSLMASGQSSKDIQQQIEQHRHSNQPHYSRGCQCQYSLATGFSRQSDGMLVDPLVREKIKKGKNISFTNTVKKLEKVVPDFAKLMATLPSEPPDSPPRYYMAYKHGALDLGEFLAIVSYLNGQDTESWVMANIDERSVFRGELFSRLLGAHDIARVIYHELNKPVKEIATHPKGEGATVHLVKLPQLSDELYTEMLMHAQPVMGTTSNHSLFLAITLGMLPLYSPHTSLQSGVNEHLAHFDHSGHLKPVFSNLITPTEKARAIQQHSHQFTEWKRNLLNEKEANQLLLVMIIHHGRGGGSSLLTPIPGSCQWAIQAPPPSHQTLSPTLLDIRNTSAQYSSTAVSLSAITVFAIVSTYLIRTTYKSIDRLEKQNFSQ
ncbi:MAG: hypothetical protein ACPG5T_04345 [Endozoicomonas sp.]